MTLLQRLDARLLPAWAVVPAAPPRGTGTLRGLDDRLLPVWAAALRRLLGRHGTAP